MIPSLLAIKKGEWSKTFLMFLYFFLVITAYYIIKPVRDSLFIEHLGAQNLPFVYLSDAVIVGIVVFFYSRFTISMESHRLSAISIGILISNLLVFRWIHTFHWAWVSFIFYIWVGIFSILTVTQFWTCANDIFDPREAKRLFGLMGSGGILGGITGGLITSKITQYVGTENLMLVSAGVLALCILVLNAVWSIASQQAAWKDQIKLEESNPNPGEGVSLKTFSLIKASRYLMLMVVLVFLMKAVSTLVDYQFKQVIQDAFTNKDQRTAFLGSLYALLNAASLVVQIFLTGWVLKRYGVAFSLTLLPFGLLLGSTALLIYPALLSGCLLKISDGSLRYSINQSAKEFLYLPLQRRVRYKVKPFIDMFVYRSAEALAATLLLIATLIFKADVRVISLISITIVLLWTYVIKNLREEHVKEIKKFLNRELKEEANKDREDISDEVESYLSSSDQTFFEKMDLLIRTQENPRDKISALILLTYCEGRHDTDELKNIIELVTQSRTKKKIEKTDPQLPPQEVANTLVHEIQSTIGSERAYVLETLSDLKRHHPKQLIDHSLARAEIFNQIQHYYAAFAIYSFYDAQKSRLNLTGETKDYLNLSICNILDEIVARIFLLLEILYDADEIEMIYKKLVQPNEMIRANALELLDYRVSKDPVLRSRLFLILDGAFSIRSQTVSSLPFLVKWRRAEELKMIRESIKGKDRWLCLCAMFLVVKFQIQDLYSEIEEKTSSEDKLIQSIAFYLLKRLQKEKTHAN